MLTPSLVALVWGLFASPKAHRRWPTGPRIFLEIAVFTGCFTALGLTGHPRAAAVLGVLTAVNVVGLAAFRQWEE